MNDSPAINNESQVKKHRPRKSKLSRQFAKWMRWLHIYLSMISFAVVFFFSITGVTLNHPSWFTRAEERFRESNGTLELAWMGVNADASANAEINSTPIAAVDELQVVEYLRHHEDLRGVVSEFTTDDYQAIVAFRAPAYAADVFIDRETGTYELTEMSHGFVALINDLHKGRDTGPNWSWLIDASAILMTFVSITGMVLVFYIKRHRASGVVVAIAGCMTLVAVYVWLVPR